MKKILFLLALTVAFTSVQKVFAQTVQPTYLKPEFKTTVGRNLVSASSADTVAIIFDEVGSGVKNITITAVKVSGTVAGKVYLYGSSNGVYWPKIDSLTLADDPAPQGKEYKPASTWYKTYKAVFITSGTQSYTPSLSMVRRPDEK